MSAGTQQRIAWPLGAWCVVFLVVLAGRPSFSNASLPVRGVADPVVALQMARDAGEVEAVLGEAPSADREVMRVKQYVDFGLIAGYLGLGLVIGRALRGRLGLLLAGLTLAAALLDARENWGTLRVVNLSLSQLNPAMLDALRLISVAKWIVLALAISVLGSANVRRRQWYLRMAAGLCWAGAGLTVAGLFCNSILVWGGLLMVLGLLLTAATLKVITHESAS